MFNKRMITAMTSSVVASCLLLSQYAAAYETTIGNIRIVGHFLNPPDPAVDDVGCVNDDTTPFTADIFIFDITGLRHDWKVEIIDPDGVVRLTHEFINTLGLGVGPGPGFFDKVGTWTVRYTVDNSETLIGLLHVIRCGPSIINVVIDVKPEGSPNTINPDARGELPVAILTTSDFDATSVDPGTATIGPANALAVKSVLEDIDKDEDLDMLLHFKIAESGISCGDTTLTLKAVTFDGFEIEGTDDIRTVPCV